MKPEREIDLISVPAESSALTTPKPRSNVAGAHEGWSEPTVYGAGRVVSGPRLTRLREGSKPHERHNGAAGERSQSEGGAGFVSKKAGGEIPVSLHQSLDIGEHRGNMEDEPLLL